MINSMTRRTTNADRTAGTNKELVAGTPKETIRDLAPRKGMQLFFYVTVEHRPVCMNTTMFESLVDR